MQDRINTAVRQQLAIIHKQLAVIQEQLEHVELLTHLQDPDQAPLPGLAVQSGPAGGQPELIAEAPAGGSAADESAAAPAGKAVGEVEGGKGDLGRQVIRGGKTLGGVAGLIAVLLYFFLYAAEQGAIGSVFEPGQLGELSQQVGIGVLAGSEKAIERRQDGVAADAGANVSQGGEAHGAHDLLDTRRATVAGLVAPAEKVHGQGAGDTKNRPDNAGEKLTHHLFLFLGACHLLTIILVLICCDINRRASRADAEAVIGVIVNYRRIDSARRTLGNIARRTET